MQPGELDPARISEQGDGEFQPARPNGFASFADGNGGRATMNQGSTLRMLRALELTGSEPLMLSAFVATNFEWIARHAVPLEIILRRALAHQRLHLVRLEKVEAHPVYVLSLRLASETQATKAEIERAVRGAFAAAGRWVKPKFTRAVLRGDRARVDVYVEDRIRGRAVPKRHPPKASARTRC